LFNDVDNSHFFDEIHLNYLEFAFLLVMRLVLVAISTTSAVPSGLFVPLFILGGNNK
jgi:H+/Cl- antiporter ClcA